METITPDCGVRSLAKPAHSRNLNRQRWLGQNVVNRRMINGLLQKKWPESRVDLSQIRSNDQWSVDRKITSLLISQGRLD